MRTKTVVSQMELRNFRYFWQHCAVTSSPKQLHQKYIIKYSCQMIQTILSLWCSAKNS